MTPNPALLPPERIEAVEGLLEAIRHNHTKRGADEKTVDQVRSMAAAVAVLARELASVLSHAQAQAAEIERLRAGLREIHRYPPSRTPGELREIADATLATDGEAT